MHTSILGKSPDASFEKKKIKYASWSSLIKTGMFDRFVILELRRRPTRSPDRNVAIRRSQIMFMILQ